VRPDATTFRPVQAGSIPPAAKARFIDCLVDGFAATNVVPREYGTRVDVTDNAAYHYMSAEVSDDGTVTLTESSVAALISTRKHQQTFRSCVERVDGRLTMSHPAQ
jgi:hypothetical protein